MATPALTPALTPDEKKRMIAIANLEKAREAKKKKIEEAKKQITKTPYPSPKPNLLNKEEVLKHFDFSDESSINESEDSNDQALTPTTFPLNGNKRKAMVSDYKPEYKEPLKKKQKKEIIEQQQYIESYKNDGTNLSFLQRIPDFLFNTSCVSLARTIGGLFILGCSLSIQYYMANKQGSSNMFIQSPHIPKNDRSNGNSPRDGKDDIVPKGIYHAHSDRLTFVG